MSGVQEVSRQQLKLIKFISATEQETPERLKEFAHLLSTECLAPSSFEYKQFSPLHYAVAKDLDGIAEMLLNHNANPNVVGKNSITPALLAACIGSKKCLEKLIKFGADVNARTSLVETETFKGCISVDCGEWADLKAVCPYHIYDEDDSSTPLHLAAKGNHIDCVKRLMDHDADVNAADKVGRTALYLAAWAGNPNCVMTILQYSRSVPVLSLPTAHGDTPLHECLRHGESMTECVKELLRRHSDVSLCNSSDESPLILAVKNKWSTDIMQLLISGDHPGHNKDGAFMNHLVRPMLQAVTDEQLTKELPKDDTLKTIILTTLKFAATKMASGITGRNDEDRNGYCYLLIILSNMEFCNYGQPDSYYERVAALLIGWGAVDPILKNVLWYEMNRRKPAGCLFEALVNSFTVLPPLTELVRSFLVPPPSTMTMGRHRLPERLHDEQILIQNGLGSSTPEVSEKYRRYLQVRSEVPSLPHQSRMAIRSHLQSDLRRVVATKLPELVKAYILLEQLTSESEPEGGPGHSSSEKSDCSDLVSSDCD